MERKVTLIDDTRERLAILVEKRLPWLIAGLLGGMVATYIVARFEDVLARNISLAFFVPIIVYLSDAVGTQTETIYVRNIGTLKGSFISYLLKELFIGICLGIIFGLLIGGFAYFWLHQSNVALTVGLAMLLNITIAPVLSLVIPEILFKEHTDPALGAGPFTTIIQDIISLLIYFSVAILIIW
ncbi:MAG: magnesium transporter [Candidatus Levybacteria bacterium]|nr:magnesium transporter [Candidatus Levybacteria bacterium]